ncbi:MAG: hypothetical protein MK010_03925, partial [Erythrobacter sp.]|nr:hypothetical protein [Erythrobacter sp.]
MAIPPSVLFAAAAKIAKDERAHKAAKYLFDSGKEMLAARQRAKVEKSSTNIGAIEAEPVTPGRRKHGLRGQLERR